MKFLTPIAITAVFFLDVATVNAALLFTLSPAGLDNAQTTATTNVETFDGLKPGRLSENYVNEFGVYSVTKGKAKVNHANLWGGAGGVGNYLFIPRGGNEVTLTFNQPVGYFGFWWSAGDAGNKLAVQTRSQSVEFTTADIRFSPALTSQHYGNPFWGNPASPEQYAARHEPFAFINLFADSPRDFIESIRFYGSNFESDNHTVTTQILPVAGVTVSRFGSTPVPEPSSLALILIAMSSLSIGSRFKKQQG